MVLHAYMSIGKKVGVLKKRSRDRLVSGYIFISVIFCNLQGDKMEAIAYRQLAEHCNNELHVGEVYFFKRVGFQISQFPPPFGLFIPTDYYVPAVWSYPINRQPRFLPA
jgi:hypothetical protein